MVSELDRARDAAGGDFASNGPACADWTVNEMPGAWGPQLLQDAYRTAELKGASIRGHMLALADAIENSRPFAMATLARTLAEVAARASYLLEPGIDALERVRRLVNDILYAAFEFETMLQPAAPDAASSADVLAKVAAEAAQRGLAYTPPVRQPPRFAPARLGDRRPTTQALLGTLTGSPQIASFYYRAGSAVLHGALHSYDTRLVIHDTPPRRAKVAAVDAEAVLRQCTFAIQLYVSYVGALMYQTGWPDHGVQAALDGAEAIWRQIDSSSPG